MQIIRDLASLRAARRAMAGRVAFVPTMGALHAGHIALIERARELADRVVASIFVNPTQFDESADLAAYPLRTAEDAAMLDAARCDLLWLPDAAEMYPDGFATTVSVSGVSVRWEGAARPRHFDGVATVVAKLFGQVRPDVALFGEKDWQQLAVVRRMTLDLDLGIEIAGVPTVRDGDGVALSSRNARLSASERAAARALPRALQAAAQAIADGEESRAVIERASLALTQAGLAVDYLALIDAATLDEPVSGRPKRIIAAVRSGATRLIDNFAVTR